MADILNGCVNSLRSSMQLLDSSISTLDSGVSDFPRLQKVLTATRHFELISEPDLHAAQTALQAEIRPEVDGLLSRVQKHLERLERREQSLIARAELQEGRLSNDDTGAASSRDGAARPPGGAAFARRKSVGGGGLEALKAQQLRQKKERLSFALERLALQEQAMQRKLRQSLAA